MNRAVLGGRTTLCFVLFMLLACDFGIAQGLVAWYKMDRNANDAGPNQLHGVMYPGVKACPDRFDNPCGALHFDGSNGFIRVPDASAFDDISNALSVVCWVRLDPSCPPDPFGWISICCKSDLEIEDHHSPQFRFQTTSGTVSLNTAFTEPTSPQLLAPGWHHLALTVGDGMLRYFVDGERVFQYAHTGNLTANDLPLEIGRDKPGELEYFCGDLDDLQIYSKELNEGEIWLSAQDIHKATPIQAVSIQCPADIVALSLPPECGARVTFQSPILIDPCGNANVRQISGLHSGDLFPVGEHRVVFKGELSSGNAAYCSFKVRVTEQFQPQIRCPRDTVLFAKPGSNAATFRFLQPNVENACQNLVVAQTQGLKTGVEFPVGKNLVAFAATLNGIQKCGCEFWVEVQATQAAKSICPLDLETVNAQGKCGANVKYTLPPNSIGGSQALIHGKPSGSFFDVGKTSIRLSTNPKEIPLDSCSFAIIVKDIEKPTIKCPPKLFFDIPSGTSAPVAYPKPQAFDNCRLANVACIAGPQIGHALGEGEYKSTWTARDIYGLEDTCTFVIHVRNAKLEPEGEEEGQPTALPLPMAPDRLEAHSGGDKVVYTDTVIVASRELNIYYYDHLRQDGDTVSVNVNGKWLVNKVMIRMKSTNLAENPSLKIQLVGLGPFYLISKAWNLGQFPPNTLTIEIHDGVSKPQVVHLDSKEGLASAIILKIQP